VSDGDILTAALRVMGRVGPRELTLAEIADEAGLTAGALVQRFGSKRALLLELAAQSAGGSHAFIRDLRAQYGSPLAALRAYAQCTAHLAASPAALVRNLAYLQIDLADPDFRKHLATQAKATRSGLVELVQEAVEIGELKEIANVAALARTIETVLAGSLLTWAYYRKGTAARWLREDLDAILAPYVTD
jgi:AcrR family transcriptional regulator